MQPYRRPINRRGAGRAIVIAGARERQALVQRHAVRILALCGAAECLLLLLRG